MKDRIQCHDKGGKVENFKEGATTKKMKKKDEEERKRNSRQENGQTKESKRGGKESKLVTAQGQMFIRTDLVTKVRVSACAGRTEDAAGTSKTSSKVSASRICIGVPLRCYVLARRYLTGG